MARSSALAPNPARRSRCSMYGDPRALCLYLLGERDSRAMYGYPRPKCPHLLGATDMIELRRRRRIKDMREGNTFLSEGTVRSTPSGQTRSVTNNVVSTDHRFEGGPSQGSACGAA